MATVTETRQIDFETFCETIAEGQKADLIDGVIYMASPDNTDAADLSFWLARLMADFADERDLGKVYQSRVACKLGRMRGPEPDVLFVHKSRAAIVFPTFIDGAPDLTVEIVSPDSVERDYVFKRRLYEQSGVAEYWIIDEMQSKAVFLRLDSRGKYREVKPKKGVFTSTALEGFWLRVEWLFERPLPKKAKVLATIFG
jgi:Uma2 family endonuclease